MTDETKADATDTTDTGISDFDKQVVEVLDLIRPALQMDGGDCEYLGTDDGFVKIRFVGACVGCPSSAITLQMGIEKTLMEKVPGVKGVIPIN